MSKKIEDKLNDVISTMCESKGLRWGLGALLNVFTSLLVFYYVKTQLKGYVDFESRLDDFLYDVKEISLQKYRIVIEREL